MPTDSSDGKVRWGSLNSVMVEANAEAAPVSVVGGGAVFGWDDSTCSLDCGLTLKTLYFEFDDIVLAHGSRRIVVDSLRIGLDPTEPASLQTEGTRASIPDAPAVGCAIVEGESVANPGRFQDARIDLDPLLNVFQFDGVLTFPFRAAPGDECQDFLLHLRASGENAEVPWDENPLCAGIDDCALEDPDQAQ